MRNHRITMLYFRTCSTCRSRSQACPYAIALYTRLPTVLRAPLEASVTLLEATTPVKLPTTHCPSLQKLGFPISKGRYFNNDSTTPSDATSKSPGYPTHYLSRSQYSSYSKGSRGLFVPLRVNGIFTATTISPSSWLRQCPDRCTIRAGRNLPDKEFRYLRTVIVTAAVYWGFNSMLRIAKK